MWGRACWQQGHVSRHDLYVYSECGEGHVSGLLPLPLLSLLLSYTAGLSRVYRFRILHAPAHMAAVVLAHLSGWQQYWLTWQYWLSTLRASMRRLLLLASRVASLNQGQYDRVRV